MCLSVCLSVLHVISPPTQACSTAVRDMWAQEIRRLLKDQFTLMKGGYSSQHQHRPLFHSLFLHLSPHSFLSSPNLLPLLPLHLPLFSPSTLHLPLFSPQPFTSLSSPLNPSPPSLPPSTLHCSPSPLLPHLLSPSLPPLFPTDKVIKSGTLNRNTYRGRVKPCKNFAFNFSLYCLV